MMREQLNEILMATKWKIHVNKQLGENTCLYQVLYTIKHMIILQELMASQNQKM